jgi:hypothetical protein
LLKRREHKIFNNIVSIGHYLAKSKDNNFQEELLECTTRWMYLTVHNQGTVFSRERRQGLWSSSVQNQRRYLAVRKTTGQYLAVQKNQWRLSSSAKPRDSTVSNSA